MADISQTTLQQRRVGRITALTTEISAHMQTAAKLLAGSIRTFFGFFVLACLTAGIVALVRGNHANAAIFGGIGIALGLVWVAAFATSRASRRAVRLLRAEAAAEQPATAPKH